jgi:hypothetical protein
MVYRKMAGPENPTAIISQIKGSEDKKTSFWPLFGE